jgi:hypothetical protein
MARHSSRLPTAGLLLSSPQNPAPEVNVYLRVGRITGCSTRFGMETDVNRIALSVRRTFESGAFEHVYLLPPPKKNIPRWYSDWLPAGRPSSSSPGEGKNFHFSMSSRPLTQPPIQWVPGVKWPGRDTDHTPPPSAEVKKMLIYTTTPPYAFMA